MRLFIVLISSLSAFSAESFADCVGSAAAPYPCSDIIRGIEFDWNTHQRHAAHSDNWPVTWASDGAQYGVWGDGFGLTRQGKETRTYSLGASRITGGPRSFRDEDIYHGAAQDCSGKNIEQTKSGGLCGKTYGIVALDSDGDGDDELYMWLSPGSGKRNLLSSRLYYSRDFGESWRKTPVSFRRKEGLIMPAFIQFGQSYRAIDQTELDPEYVYFYAIEPMHGHPRKLSVQRPGNIYLLRVRQNQMGNKSAYEYFTGRPDQKWSTTAQQKKPIFSDPNGTGWNLSAIYLSHLKRYILITEHSRSFRGKPGFFESSYPWGPWKTIAYYDDWATQTDAPASAGGHRTFYWNISAKWSSTGNPLDFTLVYSGIGKPDDSLNIVQGKFTARR